MKRGRMGACIWAVALALLCIGSPAKATDAAFDSLLAKYVRDGHDGVSRVDYAGWKASAQDVSQLNGYIQDLIGRLPSKMARVEAFVYWVNLYNAVTLKIVLDRYP